MGQKYKQLKNDFSGESPIGNKYYRSFHYQQPELGALPSSSNKYAMNHPSLKHHHSPSQSHTKKKSGHFNESIGSIHSVAKNKPDSEMKGAF